METFYHEWIQAYIIYKKHASSNSIIDQINLKSKAYSILNYVQIYTQMDPYQQFSSQII